MSYEQYWNGDTRLVWDYVKADKLRQDRENNQAWLQGMYVYNALTSALSVSELFRGKGRKPSQYPSKPYELFKRDKTEEEKEKEAQNERLRAIAHFDALIKKNKARRGITGNNPVS